MTWRLFERQMKTVVCGVRVGSSNHRNWAHFSFFVGALVMTTLCPATSAQCHVAHVNAKRRSLDVRSTLAQAALSAMSLPDTFDKADAHQEIAYVLWNQRAAKTSSFDCAFRVAIKSPADRPIGVARIRSNISAIIAGTASGSMSSAITTTNWKCFTGVA
jgi:hypothetical protein